MVALAYYIYNLNISKLGSTSGWAKILYRVFCFEMTRRGDGAIKKLRGMAPLKNPFFEMPKPRAIEL
jgi:hypothetical protein